jgi:hypothetical protein
MRNTKRNTKALGCQGDSSRFAAVETDVPP